MKLLDLFPTRSVLSYYLALYVTGVVIFVLVISISVKRSAASSAVGLQTNNAKMGKWGPVRNSPAIAIHTHVFPDGKILIWGPNSTTQNYIWDPDTEAFAQVPNNRTEIFCSGHSFLPDGRLLLTGGTIMQTQRGPAHTNIFNYINNSWCQLANMNAGRFYPTNTTLGNGEVLVVSGFDENRILNKLPQVLQTTGEWRSLSNAMLDFPLYHWYPWVFLAPNGKAYGAGPTKNTSFLDTTGAGSWTTGPSSNFGLRDEGSSVMYDEGRILIVGGGADPNAANLPTNTAEVIDLNAGFPQWENVSPMAFRRRHHNATILADGQVLVTGGTSSPGFNDGTNAVLAAEMWSPVTKTWDTMASMAVKRVYHSTAVLLPDGRVLSAGGGSPPARGDVDHYNGEIFTPPYLFNQDGSPATRPRITGVATDVAYRQTFFVETPDAASITKVHWIRLSSVTHSFNQNQRFNRLNFNQTTGGLNVIAPTNPNVCPPGHYMMFILNSNGVPSIARIVRIGQIGGPPCLSATTARRSAFDFDGDGKTDIAIWRPSEGKWYIINSSTLTTSVWQLGLSSDLTVPVDYEGDGKTDLTVWRPSGGTWHFIISSTGVATTSQWGLNGDVPVPADYDGDGKADTAVWRPSEGNWYILDSSTLIYRLIHLGMAGDRPVPADYDGDGKTDVAIWRPSEGKWYIINSSTLTTTVRQWGLSSDVPVPADYEGDGKADLAVWRPSEGTWYIIVSSNGVITTRPWGASGDVPVPADYDGDGKADTAVWRPSDGNWHILESSQLLYRSIHLGQPGDIPVPSSFIRTR